MVSEHIKRFHGVPFSILDLSPINEGTGPRESFQSSVNLAKHVEQLGFHRFWMAEHHNMPGIASAATSVILAHIAENTNHIRIGSGGVMLPNHAALVIAEQFGTLESLFPGRIDLGLGRAPGTDPATSAALRRTLNMSPEDFPMQVSELQNYFSENPKGRVKAVPGGGLNIPIWLLGSSDFSARLAAEKGLYFSFASHFAPAYTIPALKLYRDNFKPSDILSKPYAMIGVNVIAADTQEEANYAATSHYQQFLGNIRGKPAKLKAPVESMEHVWTPAEKGAVEEALDPRTTIVGDKKTVKTGLERLLDETQADELIITSQIFHEEARMRSYEIISELME